MSSSHATGHGPVVFLTAALILLTFCGLHACVHTRSPGPALTDASPSPSSSATARDENGEPVSVVSAATIGVDDVFIVRVYEEEGLGGEFRVGPDGTILFPLIGALPVQGLTPNQVGQLIADKLGRYLKRPYVSVHIKEFNSKKVFVFGEVKKPGTLKFEDNMSIIQAVTMSGGFTERASGNRTYVTRIIKGKEYKITVSIQDIAEGRTKNFYLAPGDIIFVPQTFF